MTLNDVGRALTHFATTRWSLILYRRGTVHGFSANDRLAELCQIYWQPVLTFIRRRGYLPADAQDLTQDFFVAIVQGDLIRSADPNRGRFRSLLLKSLTNFLIDADRRRERHKRGGKLQFVSWEEWGGRVPRSQSCFSESTLLCSSPEAHFDLGWAATTAERALRRLREECESKGHRRVYEVLHSHLAADRTEISYYELSTALGISKPRIKTLFHQFRARFREILRDEIMKTVENGADIDDEIRYLCAALAAATG